MIAFFGFLSPKSLCQCTQTKYEQLIFGHKKGQLIRCISEDGPPLCTYLGCPTRFYTFCRLIPKVSVGPASNCHYRLPLFPIIYLQPALSSSNWTGDCVLQRNSKNKFML